MEPAGDGLTLFIIVIVMLVLSWVTVVTRIVVRQVLIKQFGGDDWLMAIGLVSRKAPFDQEKYLLKSYPKILFTVTAGLLFAFIYFGGGYHSAELTPETISLGTKVGNSLPFHISHPANQALQYYFIAQMFYVSSTVPIKCSICVALIRIAGTRLVYRYILFGIIGLTIASGLATAIGILNVCRPIATLWGEADGTCDPSINSKVGYFFSAVCIITDWTLAILPAWILWNVQLKQRIRVIVAFLLALGALYVIISSITFQPIHKFLTRKPVPHAQQSSAYASSFSTTTLTNSCTAQPELPSGQYSSWAPVSSQAVWPTCALSCAFSPVSVNRAILGKVTARTTREVE